MRLIRAFSWRAKTTSLSWGATLLVSDTAIIWAIKECSGLNAIKIKPLKVNHSLKSCLQVSKSFQWRSWSKWLRMRRQHIRRLLQNWSKFWRKMAQISASLKNPLRSMMTQKVILLAMSKDLLSMLPSKRIHWSRTKVKRTSEEESTMLWMFTNM